MADGIPTSIDPVELGTSDSTLHSASAAVVTILKEMLAVAGTGGDAEVGIYRRTAGGEDFFIRRKSDNSLLLAADTEAWHLDLMLGPGESIRGLADLSTGVHIHLSAIEATTTGETEYPLPVDPVQLTTAEQDVHEAAAGFLDIVKEILVCAGTGSDAQVAIKRRTAGDAYFSIRVESSLSEVVMADTELWHLDLMLDEGEALVMSADVTGVDVHVSVVRIQKT